MTVIPGRTLKEMKIPMAKQRQTPWMVEISKCAFPFLFLKNLSNLISDTIWKTRSAPYMPMSTEMMLVRANHCVPSAITEVETYIDISSIIEIPRDRL